MFDNRDYSSLDTFVILICLEGACLLEFGDESVQPVMLGDVILVPASIKELRIQPQDSVKLLESYPSPFE